MRDGMLQLKVFLLTFLLFWSAEDVKNWDIQKSHIFTYILKTNEPENEDEFRWFKKELSNFE